MYSFSASVNAFLIACIGLPGNWSSLIIYTRAKRWLQWWLVAYQLVEVVSKEVCANIAPMPVVHTEERALRPRSPIENFLLRLHNVQNDGNSILVIVPTHEHKGDKLFAYREMP